MWKDFSMQTPSMLQSTLFSYQNRVHCSSVERTLFILSISLQFLIVLCLRQKAISAATIKKPPVLQKQKRVYEEKKWKEKMFQVKRKDVPAKWNTAWIKHEGKEKVCYYFLVYYAGQWAFSLWRTGNWPGFFSLFPSKPSYSALWAHKPICIKR